MAAAPVGPAVPVALPVIVAPPLGLGAAAVPDRVARRRVHRPHSSRRVRRAAGRTYHAARECREQCRDAELDYRIGYTEYLRSAGLPQVAALAVPGLVGILVLTGAGGMVGYRQAKAGHAVRVGGSARFMR